MAASRSFLSTNLRDLFDCPICMDFMYPPISQCPNGHPLCKKCKKKVNNRCPSCREIIGDTRALILEKVGDAMMFPCLYRENGCLVSHRYDLKQKHENECSHRPYECPFPSSPLGRCTFAGDIEKLVVHLTKDHRSFVHGSRTLTCTLYFKGFSDLGDHVTYKVLIHECFSQHFCLHHAALDPSSELMCVYVSFMGEESEAKKYLCRLDVQRRQGESTAKTTWVGTPLSMRENIHGFRSGGLILHSTMVLPFLRLKSSIRRVESAGVLET